MKSSLFLFLFLLFLVPLPQEAAPVVVFEYYTLALSWPNSYCMIQQQQYPLGSDKRCLHPNKKDLPQYVTIHGLWPGPNVPISTCSTEKFSFKLMGTLVRDEATKKWPDLRKCFNGKTKAKENEEFWKYEWDKHGKCSKLAQDYYMDLAMKSYDKVLPAITTAMKSHPPGGTVNIQDFTAAIENLVKIKPQLVCQKIPKGQLLSEIHFRVDKTSEELIDAGINSKCDLSIQVQFP